MLKTYTKERLDGAGRDELANDLEKGHIVFFPQCPLQLPDEPDLVYFRKRLPAQLKIKNVSYHPESDRATGIKNDLELARRAKNMLITHSERIQRFLERVIPGLTPDWTVGTSSFRPMQEKGRDLKPHSSNELVHIDAGAYGATNGDRILRFFVNVNPTEDRVWASKGTFADVYSRYGAAAGIAADANDRPANYLKKGVTDHLLTAVTRSLEAVGLAEARVLNSSPYDRTMRRFHNFMKDTPSFQADPVGHEEFRFPPYSAWMVFTDTCSHASLSGQHALVNTFLIRLACCRLQEHAPINILKAG